MSEDLTSLSATRITKLGEAAWRAGEQRRLRACVRELERRGSRAAEVAAKRLQALGNRGRPAPPAAVRRTSAEPSRAWVARLARIAREFQPSARLAKGNDYSVYVALLARDGEFGVYVGLTHRTPDARFAQHKRGVKAGRGHVRKHGVRVLHEVSRHLGGTLSYAEAKRIERRLHARMKAAGVWAEGGH